MRVLGHRLLVKPDPIQKETASGILLVPDERRAKAETVTGVVVDIGPTAYKDPGLGGEPWVKIGERVLYAKYGGKFYTNPEDNVEYVVLHDEDIIMGDLA